MKTRNLLYVPITLILLIQISGCKNSVKESAPNITYNIDADNTQDLIDLKLSNIADSFRLIPLETTKECLLDNHTEYHVGESYILAYSENGVYKFSADGKFVKKLFGKGRGHKSGFVRALYRDTAPLPAIKFVTGDKLAAPIKLVPRSHQNLIKFAP